MFVIVNKCDTFWKWSQFTDTNQREEQNDHKYASAVRVQQKKHIHRPHRGGEGQNIKSMQSHAHTRRQRVQSSEVCSVHGR